MKLHRPACCSESWALGPYVTLTGVIPRLVSSGKPQCSLGSPSLLLSLSASFFPDSICFNNAFRRCHSLRASFPRKQALPSSLVFLPGFVQRPQLRCSPQLSPCFPGNRDLEWTPVSRCVFPVTLCVACLKWSWLDRLFPSSTTCSGCLSLCVSICLSN